MHIHIHMPFSKQPITQPTIEKLQLPLHVHHTLMCVCLYFILWIRRSPMLNETDSIFIWHTEMNHLWCCYTSRLDTHTCMGVWVLIPQASAMHKSFHSNQTNCPPTLSIHKLLFGSPSGNKWFTIFGSVITIVYFASNGRHHIR